MSDSIKHECAVALLRLLDGGASPDGDAPLSESRDLGGTLLSLLLEKQHNRGQDGAGAAILSLSPEPGQSAWWIRKSASPTALADLLGAIGRRPAVPGESLFLGHLRYATYGKGDESFCHPFVHTSPRLGQTLFLAGNFNLTNTHELFEEFQASGNHPASTADGYLLCELLALGLAKPDARASARDAGLASAVCRGFAAQEKITLRSLREKETPRTPREEEPPILHALRVVLPKLDGAFTLCGMTGDGWAFAVRDAHGIRPAWYFASPHAVAVASERPAIQAALDCSTDAVRELEPGTALLISPAGEVRFERLLAPAEKRSCVFERIYFSRANDADIHRERKALGAALAPPLLRAVDFDLDHTFFSYIPNSAQVAFHGLLEALWTEGLAEGRPVRFGQIAVKDAKFRTFIADAAARREIRRHVYDVTYGLVRPGIDTLVVLDDSIVRGTTMREAILPMLDRLGPKRIVVASSAPPIRYPDCYGIDMSTLGELVAFRALENLLVHAEGAERAHAEFAEQGFGGAAPDRSHAESAEFAERGFGGSAPDRCHAEFAEQEAAGASPTSLASTSNPLAPLYARFSDEQHTAEIARLLTPPGMRAEVSVVYQTVPALHAACPGSSGDWYFTGDYPTPGGFRVLRTALANYLEHNMERSY